MTWKALLVITCHAAQWSTPGLDASVGTECAIDELYSNITEGMFLRNGDEVMITSTGETGMISSSRVSILGGRWSGRTGHLSGTFRSNQGSGVAGQLLRQDRNHSDFEPTVTPLHFSVSWLKYNAAYDIVFDEPTNISEIFYDDNGNVTHVEHNWQPPDFYSENIALLPHKIEGKDLQLLPEMINTTHAWLVLIDGNCTTHGVESSCGEGNTAGDMGTSHGIPVAVPWEDLALRDYHTHHHCLRSDNQSTSTCSHIHCQFEDYSVPNDKVIRVHHHNREQYGRKHVCSAGLHVAGKCGCECYNEGIGEQWFASDVLSDKAKLILQAHAERLPVPVPAPVFDTFHAKMGVPQSWNLQEDQGDVKHALGLLWDVPEFTVSIAPTVVATADSNRRLQEFTGERFITISVELRDIADAEVTAGRVMQGQAEKWMNDKIKKIASATEDLHFGALLINELVTIYTKEGRQMKEDFLTMDSFNVLPSSCQKIKSITFSPTKSPTVTGSVPTMNPTIAPSPVPTPVPTAPTRVPTKFPTKQPSPYPTPAPTTMSPTKQPTPHPTPAPTGQPTAGPTPSPTSHPTAAPTATPTVHPCDNGEHGCDATVGGKCYKINPADASHGASFMCGCAGAGDIPAHPLGFWCAVGCDSHTLWQTDDRIVHVCLELTQYPTLAPTPKPTNPPKPAYNASEFTQEILEALQNTVLEETEATFAPSSTPTNHPTLIGYRAELFEKDTAVLETSINFALAESEVRGDPIMRAIIKEGVAASLGVQVDKVAITAINSAPLAPIASRRLTVSSTDSADITIQVQSACIDSDVVASLRGSIEDAAAEGSIVAHVQAAAARQGKLSYGLMNMQQIVHVTIAEKIVPRMVEEMVRYDTPAPTPLAPNQRR